MPTTSPTPSVHVVTSIIHVHHRSSSSLSIALPLGICLALAVICLLLFIYLKTCGAKRGIPCLSKALAGDRGKSLRNGGGDDGRSVASDDSIDGEYLVSRVIRGTGFVPKRTGNDSVGMSDSDGSGGGSTTYFIPRTLAREVTLDQCVGKGRYGEVRNGVWQGEEVAIKIFYARDESSWLQETKIYNSVLLRHEFILSYYGSDMLSRADRTELWLITQYHPLGSLFEYLHHHTLNVDTMLNFVYSMASGLNHLHTEIRGTAGKRSIAHRDLKSKNILVKNDLTCCIADLGLAVMHDPDSEEPPDVPTHKVGTKRYMSPEMLLEKMNVFKFHAFRCADMYSLGLVLWETVRRCKVDGFAFDYEVPYYGKLPHDPDFHEVRAVVVDEKYRPPLPAHLNGDDDTSILNRILADCWRMDPLARGTALRIKKRLFEIKRRRRHSALPVVREEGTGGNVGEIVQPQHVALPQRGGSGVATGAYGVSRQRPGAEEVTISSSYSAQGPPETNGALQASDSDSFPTERSSSLYLPPDAVRVPAQRHGNGSLAQQHVMPGAVTANWQPHRGPPAQPALSADSMDTSDSFDGDFQRSNAENRGHEVSIGSMSLSIEKASATRHPGKEHKKPSQKRNAFPFSKKTSRQYTIMSQPGNQPHEYKQQQQQQRTPVSVRASEFQESTMSAESRSSPVQSRGNPGTAGKQHVSVGLEMSCGSWTESSC